MTEHSSHYLPPSPSWDDLGALGIEVRQSLPDESVHVRPSLAPVVGTGVRVRVIYRCKSCGKQAANVQDYVTATGVRVVAFEGRTYAEPGGRVDVQPSYRSTFYVTPRSEAPADPQCMCPVHRSLLVTVEQIEDDVRRSLSLDAGGPERRSDDQSNIVNVKLVPGVSST